jgi:hypothetical protein
MENISKETAMTFLNSENWDYFSINFEEHFLIYFEIELNNNTLIFKDIETKEVFTKEISDLTILSEFTRKHLSLFKLNEEPCLICLELEYTNQNFCVNTHNLGLCYRCYNKIINSANSSCCFCRGELIPLF